MLTSNLTCHYHSLFLVYIYIYIFKEDENERVWDGSPICYTCPICLTMGLIFILSSSFENVKIVSSSYLGNIIIFCGKVLSFI